MPGLFDRIYCRLRKDEINKAKVMLKRIRVEAIYDALTRSCWKYEIQYETLIKDSEVLEIKLKGRREAILIRFEKTDKIFMENYEKFILKLKNEGLKKGIYITTGAFDDSVSKSCKRIITKPNKVKIEDSYTFIKGQIGVWGTAAEVFKKKKFRFYRYLPD